MKLKTCVLLCSLLGLMSTVSEEIQAEEETKTWTGTWNNKKYGTSGPLKCVATHDGKGTWTATFTGTFQRDPFEYPAEFQAEKKGRQTLLSGKSTIRGHKYQWKGAFKGTQLLGQYTSSVGYYGTFVLKESR